MGPGPLAIPFLLVLAGAAGADAAAIGQFMVGQPIVCGWLAGWIVDQPSLGLFIGLALQLLWSRVAPVGAATYPEVGPATVAGVGAAGFAMAPAGLWRFNPAAPFPTGSAGAAALLGLTVALVTGWVGQRATVVMRRGNARLAARADGAAASGSFAGVELAQFIGAVRVWFFGMTVGAGGIAVGLIGARLLELLGPPTPFRNGWPIVGASPGLALFWFLALAAAATSLWRRARVDLWIVAAGLAAGILLGRLP